MTVLVKRPRHKKEICRRLHRGHNTSLLCSENQPKEWFRVSCGVKAFWAFRFFQNHTRPPVFSSERQCGSETKQPMGAQNFRGEQSPSGTLVLYPANTLNE